MNNTHSNIFTPFKKVRVPISALCTTLCLALFCSHSLIVKAQEKTPAGSALEQQYQADLDLWTLQAYEGDRDAQFKIGLLFTNNQFNTADYQQAVYWYKQAARQGHALAQYNLGHQYLIGAGVERNENEAMAWWLKAAEQGHALSQFNVGRGYYLAIGLEKDDSKSKYWFKRAAMNNEPKAIETLVELGWAAPDEFNLAKQDSAEVAALTLADNTSMTPVATIDDATDNTKPVAVTQVGVETTAPIIEKVTNGKPETGASAIEHTEINNHPIAVFTNPNERAVLISILNTQANLIIVESKEEWTTVRNRSGLPVWVHQDFITAQGVSGTITGNKVNARSVPLVKNGTIVGRLNKGEKVSILDQQKQWYRVMSPASFKAWVKTRDLQIKAESTVLTDNNSVNFIATMDENANSYEWLFKQSPSTFTLQLESFDHPKKVKGFKEGEKLANINDIQIFYAKVQNIKWSYYLHGIYPDSNAAKAAREEIGQSIAWIRTFGELQKNRCLAWKTTSHTPSMLNKYCA